MGIKFILTIFIINLVMLSIQTVTIKCPAGYALVNEKCIIQLPSQPSNISSSSNKTNQAAKECPEGLIWTPFGCVNLVMTSPKNSSNASNAASNTSNSSNSPIILSQTKVDSNSNSSIGQLSTNQSLTAANQTNQTVSNQTQTSLIDLPMPLAVVSQTTTLPEQQIEISSNDIKINPTVLSNKQQSNTSNTQTNNTDSAIQNDNTTTEVALNASSQKPTNLSTTNQTVEGNTTTPISNTTNASATPVVSNISPTLTPTPSVPLVILTPPARRPVNTLDPRRGYTINHRDIAPRSPTISANFDNMTRPKQITSETCQGIWIESLKSCIPSNCPKNYQFNKSTQSCQIPEPTCPTNLIWNGKYCSPSSLQNPYPKLNQTQQLVRTLSCSNGLCNYSICPLNFTYIGSTCLPTNKDTKCPEENIDENGFCNPSYTVNVQVRCQSWTDRWNGTTCVKR